MPKQARPLICEPIRLPDGSYSRDTWRFEFRHAGKRIRRNGFVGTKRQAEDAAHKWHRAELHEIEHPRVIEPPKPKVDTLATFWASDACQKNWLAQELKDSSRRKVDSVYRIWLLPDVGHLQLDQITTATVIDLAAKATKKGKKPSMRNHIVATLATIMRLAHTRGVITTLPAFEKARVKVPERESAYLTRDAVHTILATALERRGIEEYALLAFAIDTGTRGGEQLALRWQDIVHEGDRAFVHVHTAVNNSFRRNGYKEPKSGKSREIPISSSLLATMATIRATRIAKGESAADTDLIWPTINSTNALYKLIMRAGKRAKVQLTTRTKKAKLTVSRHSLRHTYGTNQMAASVPPVQVQQSMGHQSITTTMGYVGYDPTHAVIVSVVDLAAAKSQVEPAA